MNYGTLAIELFVCIGIWSNRAVRNAAIVLSVLLHMGILIALGIASFSIIMIGLVLVSASGMAVFRGSSDISSFLPNDSDISTSETGRGVERKAAVSIGRTPLGKVEST